MKKKFAAIASAALLIAPLAAHATPILDQSYEEPFVGLLAAVGVIDVPAASYYASYDVFQSFTVGISGVLSGLDIFVETDGVPTEGMLIEIVSGSDPTGTALATSFLTPSAFTPTPSFAFVDFSAASLAVTAGDFLGFRLSSKQNFVSNINQYWAAGSGYGSYSGGSGRHICDGCGDQYWDFFFRTYVDTSVSVPEPESIALLVLGLVGLGVARRRVAA